MDGRVGTASGGGDGGVGWEALGAYWRGEIHGRTALLLPLVAVGEDGCGIVARQRLMGNRGGEFRLHRLDARYLFVANTIRALPAGLGRLPSLVADEW